MIPQESTALTFSLSLSPYIYIYLYFCASSDVCSIHGPTTRSTAPQVRRIPRPSDSSEENLGNICTICGRPRQVKTGSLSDDDMRHEMERIDAVWILLVYHCVYWRSCRLLGRIFALTEGVVAWNPEWRNGSSGARLGWKLSASRTLARPHSGHMDMEAARNWIPMCFLGIPAVCRL